MGYDPRVQTNPDAMQSHKIAMWSTPRQRANSRSPVKGQRRLFHEDEDKMHPKLRASVLVQVVVLVGCLSVTLLAAAWHGKTSEPASRALRAPEPPSTTTVTPKVAWLMSFPNSGTSFTIHMTREASNCTTATNYALEGEIKDQPSKPAIPGEWNGPWLELIPNRTTTIPSTILTKTHCKGFCSGRSCGPEKTVQTMRSFQQGCLSGTRAVQTNQGLEKKTVTYDPTLVSKAIHIFRHPLDNIVARFHLEYNVETHIKGNSAYAKIFPKDASGFRRWCAIDDQNRQLLETVDARLRERMKDIPCRNDFFRYVQWHNLAFATTRAMELPTMLLHYHEYEDNFEQARDRVLDWLELPRVGEGIEFHPGKVYRHYYTDLQKEAIYDFLKEAATAETWAQIKGYDFEIGGSSDMTIA